MRIGQFQDLTTFGHLVLKTLSLVIFDFAGDFGDLPAVVISRTHFHVIAMNPFGFRG